MKYTLLLLLFITACGSLKKDTAPAPIENNQKRVETTICGSHAVGENGCAFSSGFVKGSLKIYKIYKGSVNILGLGCNVDYSTKYNADGEWLEIDLVSLVGSFLPNDCVLSITQDIEWDGRSKLDFPIKQLSGTVMLGTCPTDVICSTSFLQARESNRTQHFVFNAEPSGRYTLNGCGKELIPPSNFSGPLDIPVGNYSEKGCTFILSVVANDYYKMYKKVSYYTDSVINLDLPRLALKGNSIEFVGDDSVMMTSIDGKLVRGSSGSFKPQAAGNTLRFYTSQGRTLVVFIQGGKIVWSM